METKLVEQVQNTFLEHFTKLNDRIEADEKARGEARAEDLAAREKMQDDLDKATAELSMLKTARERNGAPGGELDAKRAAVSDWVRKGDDGEALAKGMRVADDTAGGFLAPIELSREIVTGIVEFSPVREVAAVRSTSARAVAIPKRTGLASASWADEVEERTETDGPAIGLDEIPNHEQYARVKVSAADLEDTEFDLAAFIEDSIREQFGVAEGMAFVSGDGVKRPRGFLVAGQGVPTVESGDASAVTSDGLLDLVYDLPDGYARAASFLLKRSTVRDIRKLKNTAGDYVWAPGLSGSEPATILGYGYREAVDMPAAGAGANAVAFGDWKRGYQIVDRIAVSFVRDALTEAKYGNVIIHARKRVGGQVLDPGALRVQVIGA